MASVEERRIAALAGLSHDLGKLAQRAGERPSDLFDHYSPEEIGWHGAHARLSADVVAQYVPEPWGSSVLGAVLYHHAPRDGLSRAVALGDRLSAQERQPQSEAAPRRLLSPFSRLAGWEGEDLYMPLSSLSLERECLFPEPASSSEAQEEEAYRTLYGGLCTGLQRLHGMALQHRDLEAYLRGFLLLLQRYACTVPAAYYRSRPDISLYDHSRATAALAACLMDLPDELVERVLAQDERVAEEPLCLLVAGDVSGVQSFLYTLTAAGAARSLRGRSFYLQALTEAAARFVLRQLGLPFVNLIYAGGGHFYLLAQAGAAGELEGIAAQVTRAMLRQHGPALYLALGHVPLSARDFEASRFSQAWRRAGEEVARRKRQRYVELGAEEMYRSVFLPYGEGGGTELECSVCHVEEEEPIAPDPEDPELRRCELCRSLEELGRALVDATHLVLADVRPQQPQRGGFRSALHALGMDVALLEGERVVLGLRERPERAEVLNMRPRRGAADPPFQASCPVVWGDRPVVNVVPRAADGGTIKEFSALEKESRGAQRLGALRMDVDSLGSLFSTGFGTGEEAAATFSRVASLSAWLQRFFEGWVGEICRALNAEQGSELIYTVYSGGDDVFVVGTWHVLPELARRIREDFARFACHNPAVTLSAGLTLHGGKYPLLGMAEQAGEALSGDGGAKDFCRPDGREKDALNFLGLTVGWEECARVWQLREELERLSSTAGRGLLQLLQRLCLMAGSGRNQLGQEQVGPWVWLAAYFLTRAARQHREEAEAILSLRDLMASRDSRERVRLLLAARWAELITRKQESKQEA